MMGLPFAAGGPKHVLCLGAHCDDIDIGCGATLLQLAANPKTAITWIMFSSTPERAAEARASASGFLGDGDNRQVIIKEYRDGFLPAVRSEVKDEFESLKSEVDPDLIFTHTSDDLHQDHRLINELTWNTFRNHLILEYEIPKYDGDLGRPNVFVPASESLAAQKFATLEQSYPSQSQKRWFSEDLFRALMRLRGMECNADSGLAEAFYARKLVLTP